jgi:predicted transposase/invertase (TIGR01784 family)
MSVFINPYTDFGFMKLFGEEANKDLLIDFLNQLLPEKHQIAGLVFKNPENLPDTTVERKAIFDIHCTALSGERFIVEMQKAEMLFFKDRSLFYTTFPIREQAKKGKEWNFELQPVYFIAILDFEYDEEEDKQKFFRDVSLKDQDGEEFFSKLKFKFLQMPLFDKQENELLTKFDKWCYFLKNLADFDKIPEILNEPIFRKAFGTAKLSAMTAKQRASYERSLKNYRDMFSVVETAVFKAVSKAVDKAVEQRDIEIAEKSVAAGLSNEMIMQITGLSQKEVEKLRKKTNNSKNTP